MRFVALEYALGNYFTNLLFNQSQCLPLIPLMAIFGPPIRRPHQFRTPRRRPHTKFLCHMGLYEFEFEFHTPITDTTPVLNANPFSNTPITTNPTPVTVGNPPSNTTEIVAVLHDLGFTLSPAGGRRPVDEQTSLLRIDPLRQSVISRLIWYR